MLGRLSSLTLSSYKITCLCMFFFNSAMASLKAFIDLVKLMHSFLVISKLWPYLFNALLRLCHIVYIELTL